MKTATPPPAMHWTRRSFLKTFTGGLAVLCLVDFRSAYGQAESGGRGVRRGDHARPRDLAAWLHIDASGRVTVFTGKAEVGQNIRTSLTQAVAEELPVPLAAIALAMADTARVPFDAGTFGSRTTPDMNLQLRRVAATAREALLDLAAKQWNVNRITLRAVDGKVVDASRQRALGFGELTRGEKLVLTISDDIPLKPANEWTIAGTSVPKVNGAAFVTGRHAYTIDLRAPDLMHGRVLRPPAFRATLTSLDSSATEAMPGVTVVRDGDFVGVVAATEQLAARGVAALRAEWSVPPQIAERELFEHLRATGRNAPPAPTGELAPGTLRQSYTVAYIAHAPLEPRAALATWQDGMLTVHTGTQRPFGVRGDLAELFGLPEEKVRVIVPDTGSGYGGKHTGEAALEAARLAKATGKTVKLAWTREEEFTWAYFRPAGVMELTSAVNADGRFTRWEHHNFNSGNAGLQSLYDAAGRKQEYHPSDSPLRIGSYRALASTANHFARETHVDETARALDLDPLEFRLRNLSDPRARAVLLAAAEKFGWRGRPRAKGRGCGLAFGHEKGGYLATCAEIVIDRATGGVRVPRVVQAFECGAIVNPDHLKNQNEGAIVQGLGGALFEAIRFEHGRILNARFSQYRVPRFSDAPQIEIVLLDRKDLPSAGAGEAPIVGIAPAVGNAIFDATGVRLRSLPLLPNGLKV